MLRCRECGTVPSKPNTKVTEDLQSDRASHPPTALVQESNSDSQAAENGESSSVSSRSEKSSNRIKTRCKKCREPVVAPTSLAGTIVRCPSCGEKVRVPKPRSEQTEATPAVEALSAQAKLLKSIQSALLLVQQESIESPTSKDQVRRSRLKKIFSTIDAASGDSRSYEKTIAAKTALKELGELGSTTGGETLLQMLTSLPDKLRPEALQTIGKLRVPGGFEPILRSLLASSASEVESSVQALGDFGLAAAVQPLLLLAQIRPELRMRIAVAIARIGDDVIPALTSTISNSDDEEAREMALESLKALRSPKCFDTIVEVISNDQTNMRRLAAEALGDIEHPKKRSLIAKLVSDRNPEIRALAISALSRNPRKSSLNVFVDALSDSSSEVQKIAIQTLGEVGDTSNPVVMGTLQKHLQGDQSDLQMASVEALGRLGETKVIPSILKLLNEEIEGAADSDRLRTFVKSLQRLRDPRAVLPLCEVFESSDSARVRRRVVDALGVIGDPAAKTVLERSLRRDESEEVRAASAQALGILGDQSVTPSLIDALHDASDVRIKALIALGKLKSPTLGPAIKEMLSDSSPTVRYQAANILGELGDAAYIQNLEVLVNDADQMVQRAACKALEALGDQRSEKELRKAAQKLQRSSSGSEFIPESVRQLFVGIPQNAIIGGGVAIFILICLPVLLLFRSGSSVPDKVVVRGYVGDIAVTEDGSAAVVSRTRGMTETWNLRNGERLWFSVDPPTAKGVIACTKLEVAMLATGKSVFFYDFKENGELSNPEEEIQHTANITQTYSSPNRQFGVTFDTDGTAQVWSLKTRKSIGSLAMPGDTSFVAVNNLGTLVAGGAGKGILRVWAVKGGEIMFDNSKFVSQEKIKGRTIALAISPDSKFIANCTTSGTLMVSDLETGRNLSVREVSSGATELYFTSQNELLLVNSHIQKLANLKGGDFETVGQSIRARTTSSFCPDSNELLMGSDEEKPVTVLNIGSGKTIELDAE